MSTLTKSREGVAQTVLIPRVNLLPPEIAEATRFDQMKRIMAASIIGVFGVVILAAVVASFQVSAAQSQLADAQATGTNLQNQVSQFTDVPKVFAEVQSAQAQLSSAMGNEVRWSTYLGDLSLMIPRNVGLTSMSIRQDPGAPVTSALGATGIATVSFEGQASSSKNIATFLDSLAKQKGYIDPYFTNATKSIGADAKNLVTFTASVTVTDEAKSGRFTQKASK
jgi:Tfp pilus assembly protein PilN